MTHHPSPIAPTAPAEPVGGPLGAEQPAAGPRVAEGGDAGSGRRTAALAPGSLRSWLAGQQDRAARNAAAARHPEAARTNEGMAAAFGEVIERLDQAHAETDEERLQRWAEVIARADGRPWHQLTPSEQRACLTIATAAIREADDEHTGAQLACAEQAARATAHLEGVAAEADGWQRKYEAAVEDANRWRHKAVRRALRIARIEGAIQAVHELAREEVTTTTTEWANGYREALSDLRELLGAVQPDIDAPRQHCPRPAARPTPTPPEDPTMTDQTTATACCCGEPSTPAVVHRADGPCYMAEPAPADEDRRQQYARAIWESTGLQPWEEAPHIWRADTEEEAAAVMAVADAETARLCARLAAAEERARKAERAVNLLADAHRRAERAEAALARVRALHTHGRRTNTCNDCGMFWPCDTIRALAPQQ